MQLRSKIHVPPPTHTTPSQLHDLMKYKKDHHIQPIHIFKIQLFAEISSVLFNSDKQISYRLRGHIKVCGADSER